MKTCALLALASVSAILCGCGSIVNSVRETELPKTSDPLTGIRYYLPKGRVQFSAEWDIKIPGWNPTITTLIEADPNACYRVDRNVNAFFDDDITLQVDPMTGLLQAASATSTDETVSAIANLAAGAENALTFGANLGVASTPAAGRGREELTPEQQEDFAEVTNNAVSSMIHVIVDPRDPAPPKQPFYLVSPDDAPNAGQSNAGQQRFGESKSPKYYAKYVFDLKRINDEPSQAGGPSTSKTNLSGIVVRTPIPYKVTVTGTFYKEDGKPVIQPVTSQIVFLPDDDHDYFLPLTRIPLVTTSTKVALVNGMVQSVQRSRPSLLNAIAGVPKNILSALIPLPLAIHQNNVQVAAKPQSGSTGKGTTGKGATNP
jgi:hypothetical protein